ncbi:MAG: SIS domain-containing protein [Burkholderiales bacterium]|nr:SIS domain-containing protein [Burkholderiales bacterium]
MSAATLYAAVEQHFAEAMQTLAAVDARQYSALADAAETIVQALLGNHRVFTCGNGGSASDAEHLVAELVGRLEAERPGLPALALTANSSVLTALGNDYGYDEVFARQVQTYGGAGDVLVAFSTSGNSRNVLAAVRAAQERDMPVVAFTGAPGGALREQLGPEDRLIAMPATRIMRAQELHRIGIHALCDAIDRILLGGHA